MDLENQLLRLINKWASDKRVDVSQDDAWELATRIALIAKAKTKSEMRKS